MMIVVCCGFVVVLYEKSKSGREKLFGRVVVDLSLPLAAASLALRYSLVDPRPAAVFFAVMTKRKIIILVLVRWAHLGDFAGANLSSI